MIQTNEKGCKELLTQRMFLAILSSVIIQFFFASCIILINNLGADYTLWIQDAWTVATSFRVWCYFIVLGTVTFLQGVICSKKYLNRPPRLKSRFSKIREIFTAQNSLLCLTYLTVGGTLIWPHMSLQRKWYNSEVEDYNKISETFFHKEHYFLLLSGFWSGIYHFARTSFFGTRYLRFPIIPLSKLFQLKRHIYIMLPSLLTASLWPTLYFLIGYYFLGAYFHVAQGSIISAQVETEPLSNFPSLLNLLLLFQLWLGQFTFMLAINSTSILFQIYLTEWIPFKFSRDMLETSNSSVTLSEVLAMDEIPIMQHLGYLDLLVLAQKDKIRRRGLFMLSQPGGHPYNWNSIVEKCLNSIQKFSNELTVASQKTKEQQVCSTFVPSTSDSHAFQTEYSYHPMRKLVMEKSPVDYVVDTDPKEVLTNEFFLHRFVKSKYQALTTYLLSKPLIHYIFGEQDEKQVQNVLFDAQSIIWAADAISSLAVISLTEDSYGIVQKDLPAIINALLSLKQSLDKLQKSNILSRKQQGDDKLVRQIFTSLRSATKRSLYRIVTHFKDYITDIALDYSAVEQLQSFLNYKE